MSTPQSVRTDVGYVTELPASVSATTDADATIASNTALFNAENAASGADITVTLPDARTNNGQLLLVNAVANTDDVIITPATGDTLAGGDITVAGSATPAQQVWGLIADGTTWNPVQLVAIA